MLRHYLRLSQQTLGMMGVSLFGTCTMKYNPAVSEALSRLPEVREVHPLQAEETMQGLLEVVYRLDLALRELSGMDRFVFQAGGGADASYLNACVTRAYHDARGELSTEGRSHHDHPGPPVQLGHGGGGGVQGHHPATGGARLLLAGRPRIGPFGAHRRIVRQQPGRHGHL